MIETATYIKEKEKAIGNNDIVGYLAGYPGIILKFKKKLM